MKPKYFDIHSHLNFSVFDKDREEVIKRMHDGSVWTICVGTDLKTSKEVVVLAEKNEGIFAVVGLHPNDAEKETFAQDDYARLVESGKVVAIGECGLDYYRIRDNELGIKNRQKENFENQIQLALENNLPLMCHFRPSANTMDAYEDAYDILSSYKKTYGEKLRGNSHFFAGDLEIAKKFLDIGFMLSFAGPITFSSDYDEVIKYAPLDMIHAETDSPFAAPAPYRGKRNEPVYVKEAVKHITEIRDENTGTIEKALVDNAFRMFSINSTLLS